MKSYIVHRMVAFLWAIVLACAWSAIDATALRAQDAISFYTTFTVGDTVLTYGDDNRYTARLYAFVDETSCFTCMQTMSNIAHRLSKRNDIQIVLFMRTRNVSSIERFQNEYDWPFPIVHDAATAYKQLYKVLHYPVCFLTDVAGVIQFIDVPGKATFNLGAFEKTLAAMSKKNISSAPVRRVHAYPVKLGDSTVPGGWTMRTGQYVASRDNFLFWNFDLNEFYLVDRRGKVVKHVDMSQFEKYNITAAIPVRGRVGPKSIAIANVNYHMPPPASVYAVDLETEEIRQLFNSPVPDSAHFASEKVLQVDDTTFWMGNRYTNSAVVAVYPNLFTSRVISSSGKVLGTRGRYEQYVRTLPVQKFFSQAYGLDNAGNVYELTTFGDTIYMYDRAGTVRRTLYCDYDSTLWNYGWRASFARVGEGARVEEYKKLSDSLVAIPSDGLLYDTETAQLYAVYRSKRVSSSGAAGDRYCIHHPAQPGFTKTLRRDVALPDNVKPIHIEKGLVYCMETVDGVMNLTVYDMPDWL
jgi:hypothetical protein